MFDFGSNWKNYLRGTDISSAAARMQASMSSFQGEGTVRDKTFLDVGCGSGLSSLAALRLDARSVVSVDLNPGSIECALELRARHGYTPARWRIERGSALDPEFMASLPPSEVVYAWGVLHHTGDMARAFELTCSRVLPGGLLHTAIYNRTWTSPAWRVLKRAYNHRGRVGRFAMHSSFFAYNAAARALGGMHPLRRERGMSVWYDAVDWLGGYPYEYATLDEVVAMVNRHGSFELVQAKCDSGFGCNEMLFRRA